MRDGARPDPRAIAEGKKVKLLTVGRKARDLLRRDNADRLVVETFEGIGCSGVAFGEAENVADAIVTMFEAGEFDVCTIIYNRFKSVIAQIPTAQQLIPFALPRGAPRRHDTKSARSTNSSPPKTKSWRSCCRAISPSRSSARCWTARPASRPRA